MSVRQRFAIGALLLMGGAAWTPKHPSLVKHQPSTNNNKQSFELKHVQPIQWVAAGILAASVAFAPLPSAEAIIDPTPVGNDLSVKVLTSDDDVTISFSLPRSLIKSIDINDNQGQAKQGDKVDTPPVMPAPENSMTDVMKGALNALTGKDESPSTEVKEEESKPVEVKNEESKPEEAKVDEQKPLEETKVETPAAVEQKQEPAKVEEPTAEIPKQEIKKEPSAEVELKKEPPAPVEVKKDEPPTVIEEKKPESPPVEAQIEQPKPLEVAKEEPKPTEVKKEEVPKAIIVEQAKQTKPSTLSGSILDKVNKAEEVSKVETPPKPEIPRPTPKVNLAKPFSPKKEAPKAPSVESKSTIAAEETDTSAVSSVFNDFASKLKGKKKEKPLPFWERPAFQTAIQSRNGDVHLAVTNGQVAGVTVVGLGAALVATFKADNSEREERRRAKGDGETATNNAGPKATGPSSASGDVRSFVDATIESSPTITVEKDDTSENGIGSLLSAFLKPKKDSDKRDDHKRRDLQKEEAVAAAKRAISTKRKAASMRESQALQDSMPTAGEPSYTIPTEKSSPASSFPSRSGANDPVRSEETNRSQNSDSSSSERPSTTLPSGTRSGAGVSERPRNTTGYSSASPGTSSQQQMAPPMDGAPAPNTQDQKEPVPSTRFDETTGRYVFEYGGKTIYEWEQNLEEVIIYIRAPPGITQDQIACNIFPRQLQLGLRGSDRFFIDKETYDFVVTSESSWYMNGDTIEITLQKARRGVSWERALQTLGTSSSPSRTAPTSPSSPDGSDPVKTASSGTERRSASPFGSSGTSTPGFGASTVTGGPTSGQSTDGSSPSTDGPPNTISSGFGAQTRQNIGGSSTPPTSRPSGGGIPGFGASSFANPSSNTGGSTSSSSTNTPPGASSSGVPGIGASSFTDALSKASASSSKPPSSGGGVPGFGASSFANASSNAGGPSASSSKTDTLPRTSSSGVPGIGASSFTDALSNASASSSKPPSSRPSGGGIPGFGANSFANASSNTAGSTSSSSTSIPPEASSSGVTGIGASSFTDALSNVSASSSKPPSSRPSGGGIPGFGASSFANSSWNAPPPAPQAMAPPPAPVPSTTSPANRPDVENSTTLPSGGPAPVPATSSTASYAEQMRATAPAESESTGDGASDEYLAAMSVAVGAPRVSPPSPPSPPPAPIGRTERVMPSSTSEDANTAAGADYLSMMGGGIPQKQPPKQGSSSTTSGGIPGFGASSFIDAVSSAVGSAGSSSTKANTPSRPTSGGIPGFGASSFTNALSNPTTDSSPIPPPSTAIPGDGTSIEATPWSTKKEVTSSGPSTNESAPQPKVSLIFKNNVGGGTRDKSDTSPQVNKAVRGSVRQPSTPTSGPPAETSSYDSGPAFTSRQSSSRSVPPQSSGTSRSNLDPLTGASSRSRNDASSAGNRPFLDGDSNTKTISSPKSFNPRTEMQRRKAQEDALAAAKRKFAEQQQGASKSKMEPPSYLGAFRKPMAPRPAASNEESKKDKDGGAFMSGLPNFSDPGRAERYTLNPAIAEKAKQIREAMEAAKRANKVNKNGPNDSSGAPNRRN